MAKENFEEYLKVKDALVSLEYEFHMLGLAKELNFVLLEFMECLLAIKETGEFINENKFSLATKGIETCKLHLLEELENLYKTLRKKKKEAK